MTPRTQDELQREIARVDRVLAHIRNRSPVLDQVRSLYGRGAHCAYCGGKHQSADHVVPVSSGGETRPGNLVPACLSCNTRKGSKRPAKWFAENPEAAVHFVRLATHADPKLRAIAERIAREHTKSARRN